MSDYTCFRCGNPHTSNYSQCDDCANNRTPMLRLLAKRISVLMRDCDKRILRLARVADLLVRLEDSGFPIGSRADALLTGEGCGALRIARHQLPLLRRIVGRVRVVDKSPRVTKERTEIEVVIQPVDGDFAELTFRYTTPYRATESAKCQIVTTTQQYVAHQLVCRK